MNLMGYELASYISAGSLIAIFVAVVKSNSDNDVKISRVYRRLDEVKLCMRDEFVQDKVCDERHKRVEEKIDRVESDTKEIKKDIKKILEHNGYSK